MLTLGKDVTVTDIERMTARLYITDGPDRGHKWSAFWVLLVLAAIIASAGVVADSTATVIGAMIVAPLMTPILGHRPGPGAVRPPPAAALHRAGPGGGRGRGGDRLRRRIACIPSTWWAPRTARSRGRVSPKLIDLTAALATGVVGAFALVRADVSDTLPGVAIAISLVPPLAVVGLTLEAGSTGEALGALLLFATNVAAIIATGTFVLLAYRIRRVLAQAGRPIAAMSRRTVAVVVATVALVAIPLAWGTLLSAYQQSVVIQAEPIAQAWAEQEGWIITDVSYQQDQLRIVALGSLPEADPAQLRLALDDAGLEGVDTRVVLVIGGTKDLPATDS